MNARKAVLADNPELILRVLQLRFDESLSYPRISAQTGISKTAIFSLVRRFHQVFTDWPLSGEYSCVQLARALFPGRYPSAPTVTQTVKTEKNRRNRFSPEFKWRLVQQTLLPGACVAQIARENGIAKWHLNRSQFGIRIDHDLASISDHSLASQSITIWHASDH